MGISSYSLEAFSQCLGAGSFFRPDIWHCYHGGAGKLFVASALAEALALFDGSMDNRVEQMAEALRTWAKKPGNQLPHSGQFCKERIQLTSYQVLPDASWSKFNDTYVYHRFLEWLLMENLEQVSDNETLKTILDATRCINRSFKILYQSGLFLTSAEALEAGQLGRTFLRLYVHLAYSFYEKKQLRFPLVVKHHLLDHIYRRLIAGSKTEYSLNCLLDSVQMDEDFIGHCPRLSRRVSPVTTALRVLQRYCVRAKKHGQKMSKTYRLTKNPKFQALWKQVPLRSEILSLLRQNASWQTCGRDACDIQCSFSDLYQLDHLVQIDPFQSDLVLDLQLA